ncbi:adenylyltransferase/cytidyltransferase family protein [Streptomyces aidingensis]|uniref:Glycerol-3-phosphate cytidylyltransferase n=1 Tax=Streptomyces aidingensis TaxID=910347 RepID=A0A1I1L5Y0_9ACTN|nr:adenylyltransferase/cytidyltransferase family protein [Streptomyces aidingensis]SFC68464.1 glycerol-3-phosphate cytidylyltransferase [Streptomyces aidingensis]
MPAHLVGYAPGVYDLFHIGHLNVLRHARSQCDYLIAGVVADEAAEQAKGRPPVVPLVERLEIVRSIRFVDAAVAETPGDTSRMWHQLRYHRLFKGDDWRGTPKGVALEEEMGRLGVEVVYFPYTVHTSSTQLRGVLDALVPPRPRTAGQS